MRSQSKVPIKSQDDLRCLSLCARNGTFLSRWYEYRCL